MRPDKIRNEVVKTDPKAVKGWHARRNRGCATPMLMEGVELKSGTTHRTRGGQPAGHGRAQGPDAAIPSQRRGAARAPTPWMLETRERAGLRLAQILNQTL